jgi:hypothetical protein
MIIFYNVGKGGGGVCFVKKILTLMSRGFKENHALQRGNLVTIQTCTRTEENHGKS